MIVIYIGLSLMYIIRLSKKNWLITIISFICISYLSTNYVSYKDLRLNIDPPKHHLVFLKNHKCASTTVERIFLRYGKKYGLTFALPWGGNRIGVPEPFNTSFLGIKSRTPNNMYDLYVLHSRLNEQEIRKITYPDSVWVTILREPMAQFESMWNYYDIGKKFRTTVEDYLAMEYKHLYYMRKLRIHGIHQMFYDLGYGSFEGKDDDYIMKEVKRINKLFDLIMIAERFDESLVILRDLMKWTFEDIAYISINFREKSIKQKFSDKAIKMLEEKNRPDILLYNYTKKLFAKRVQDYGLSRMTRDVAKLKMECAKLKNECTNGTTYAKKEKGFKYENSHIWTYNLKQNSEKCHDLLRFQPDFVDEIRLKQEEIYGNRYKTDSNTNSPVSIART